MTSSPEYPRPASPSNEPPYPSPGYAWYVVFILMVVYVFSFIDRQILAFLVGPIRADFNISDTEMSLLMGFTFALFYTFFGIPLGRIADSRSRRGLIAIGFVFWSLATAGCGLAQRYVHLLIMRVCVGVGEATLSPAAYSMITDYFPPKRLGLAVSVYSMGIYIGSGMAFLLGGLVVGFATQAEQLVLPLVGEVKPWQLVFFTVGLPGIVLAGLLITVREPVRRGHGKAQVPMGEVITYLSHNRAAFLLHSTAFGIIAMVGYGGFSWIPTFLIRTHGWTHGDVGLHFGFSVMIFGSLGIVCGGHLADTLRARGYTDGNLRVGILTGILVIPLTIAYTLAPSGGLAILCLHVFNFVLPLTSGTAPAAIQQMMPNAMRGQASALYLFIVNIIGLGIGPTAVAFCTDYVYQGDEMVRYSLATVGVTGGVLGALCFALAMGPYRRSLQYLHDWQVRTAEQAPGASA